MVRVMIEKFAPSIISNIEEISAIWKAVEVELSKLYECIVRLPSTPLAHLADETAIKRLEKLYNINDLGCTLAERKALCETSQAMVKSFTMKTLEKILEALAGGKEAYSIEFEKEYSWLKIGLDASDHFLKKVFEVLRGLIPANIILTVERHSFAPSELKWCLLDEDGAVLTDEEGYILIDKECE